MQTPVISAVVLNWNRAYLLEKTLASFLATVSVPHELWIVDNASTDNSQEIIARFCNEYADIKVRALPENVGGEAFNAVLPELKGEFILLSENDQIFLPGWGEQVLRAFRAYPRLGQMSLHAPVPTDDEAWVSKPVNSRFKNGCLLYQAHFNVGTSCVLGADLVRNGLRVHNIPGEIKFPDDARLSHEVKQRGFWVGFSDRYYARNAGHEAEEIASHPEYYQDNYAAKPSVGIQGLEQRMQLQKRLKQVKRFSLSLPEEHIMPQLANADNARFWSMFDSRTPEVECVDLIAALIRANKPVSVLEAGGWLGHVTQAVAEALAANGFGRLTTLEADAEAHAHLAERIRKQGLNVELRQESIVYSNGQEAYDCLLFYAEHPPAKFLHVSRFLRDDALLIFSGYRNDMPASHNLPRQLEQRGMLREALYLDSPRGLCIGRLARAVG